MNAACACNKENYYFQFKLKIEKSQGTLIEKRGQKSSLFIKFALKDTRSILNSKKTMVKSLFLFLNLLSRSWTRTSWVLFPMLQSSNVGFARGKRDLWLPAVDQYFRLSCVEVPNIAISRVLYKQISLSNNKHLKKKGDLVLGTNALNVFEDSLIFGRVWVNKILHWK